MHASLFFFSAPSLLVFFSHSDRWSVVAWMKKGELQDTWIKWEDPIYFDYHLWSWSPTHSPSDYGVCVVNQLKFPTNSKDTVASSKNCRENAAAGQLDSFILGDDGHVPGEALSLDSHLHLCKFQELLLKGHGGCYGWPMPWGPGWSERREEDEESGTNSHFL